MKRNNKKAKLIKERHSLVILLTMVRTFISDAEIKSRIRDIDDEIWKIEHENR